LENNGNHPSRIGRYAVVDCIGNGAISRVYAAVDESIGRRVAIRVGTAGDPRVHQQARLTGQVAHPNVVSVLDLGESDGAPFAVMERLDGATLAAGPSVTELDQQLHVMLQVCDGLLAAHARGVVHGAVKPGHVFIQNDGVVKLLDFGGDGESYSSPEQLSGEPATVRSDVFSAGAIFATLAGDIPDGLRRTLLKAIEKDPQRRHVSIAHLRAEIDQVRAGRQGDRQRVLIAAFDRYHDIESLLGERRALGRRLGMPAVERECDERLTRLAAAFPEFARAGLDINAVGDVEPARLTDALEQLQVFHNDVAAEISVLRSASGVRK
jgi:serine/threonine protein kinase